MPWRRPTRSSRRGQRNSEQARQKRREARRSKKEQKKRSKKSKRSKSNKKKDARKTQAAPKKGPAPARPAAKQKALQRTMTMEDRIVGMLATPVQLLYTFADLSR